MDSLLDSTASWADTIGGLADKYLDFRRVQSMDAINATQAKYQADAVAAQTAAQAAGSTSPAWLMPALLLGGGVLLLLLVRR